MHGGFEFSICLSGTLNGSSVDDDLTIFFKFLFTNYAFEPHNHKTLFDFTLLCLWNVQIQVQFW